MAHIVEKRVGVSGRAFRYGRTLLFSALLSIAALLSTGCGLDFTAASLDLNEIELIPESPREGEEATISVEFSNRSDKVMHFACRVGDASRTISVLAPPNAEESDVEFSWPGLPRGKHTISCGPVADEGAASKTRLPEVFTLSKTVEVGPSDSRIALAAADADGPALSISDLKIIENEQVWSGKLRFSVAFQNPSGSGGAVRCATAPSTIGPQLARITREPSGVREFEFTYPENQSAAYRILCAPAPVLPYPGQLESETFNVGL